MINGISNQVAHNALNPARITLNLHRRIRQIKGHLHIQLFCQVLHLRPRRLNWGTHIHHRAGQVSHARVMARNLQQVRQQSLKTIQLTDHQLTGSTLRRLQRILIRSNHVRSHTHRGQRRTQLMRHVGCELTLQVTVLLQLINLPGKLVRHVVEGQGQHRHLVLPLNRHTLTQMACCEPLRRP